MIRRSIFLTALAFIFTVLWYVYVRPLPFHTIVWYVIGILKNIFYAFLFSVAILIAQTEIKIHKRCSKKS